MHKRLKEVLKQEGYRCFRVQPEEVGVFYKYYQEGFHVIITIDLDHGYFLTQEQHKLLAERTINLFYHPQGRILDFPEGFPVYHVETITLLIGKYSELMRKLCAAGSNIWAYLPEEGRLVIYENQPGDFWGLKAALESAVFSEIKNIGKKAALRDAIKGIKFLPYITAGIAFANVAVYIILEIMGDTENAVFIANHGGMYPKYILCQGEWWRILTACFIHFGAVHLLNNMVIFCCVGSRLERAAGHARLLAIYLISGISGGLLSYFMMIHTGDYAVSAGASGAVFGTIGGLLWAVILHRGRFEGLTTRGMILMIALSLYYGFSTIGVDNWSHIGGIMSGFIIAAILYHRKYQKC